MGALKTESQEIMRRAADAASVDTRAARAQERGVPIVSTGVVLRGRQDSLLAAFVAHGGPWWPMVTGTKLC